MLRTTPTRCLPTTPAWVLLTALAPLAIAVAAQGEPVALLSVDRDFPSVQEMIDARTDVWGEAARRQPNGASYEFFKDLLPPLRWVNTDFRHYPIVLSAPRSPHKTRLVSNGGAVNARANKPPMWYEQGVPVALLRGRFGGTVRRMTLES